MASHHHQIELLFLRECSDFVARVAHEANFLGRETGLGQNRTDRVDSFAKLLLLQFEHFAFGQCRKCHACHVGHHSAGVVTGDVDQIERGAFTEEFLVTHEVLDCSHAELGTVNGDAYAHGVRFGNSLVAHDQNRVLGTGENTVGHRTKEETCKSGAAARTHDHQIGIKAHSFFGDLFGRIAYHEGFGYRDVLVGQELASRFKNLFRFFFVVACERILTDQACGTGGQRIKHDQKFNFGGLTQKRRAGGYKGQRVFAVAAAVDRNENFHTSISFVLS